MRCIVDFHIHSKYSRATSKNLDLHEIAKWAKIKGLDIVSCGDFTHPRRFAEIKQSLREDGSGLLTLEDFSSPKFILSTEVSCIYQHNGKTRRLHHVILTPSLSAVEKINTLLLQRGAKLASDGRPILGMSSKELLSIVLEADEQNVLIPSHVWTPWFAIFGSKSGYDSVDECFEDLTPHIFALETGLSSDPEMNWTLSALDTYVFVSNSDAHSGPKLGREANVFDLEQRTFSEIIALLKSKDKKKFLFTIEFFPEEGMYHYDGHRLCHVSCDPAQTKKYRGTCPVCKKPLTIGVLHRVDNLRDRNFGEKPASAIPFKKIVPLPEILAEYYGVASSSSTKVENMLFELVRKAGSEYNILLDMSESELKKIMPDDLTAAIIRMRNSEVQLTPGYDGSYGTVRLFSAKNSRFSAQPQLL